MESGKIAETLDEAFLELKLSESEILCGKFREDGNLGFLCNLNEKCGVNACGGNGSVEDSLVDGFAGNRRTKDGNDFRVLKGELKFTPKGEECVGKFDDPLHCDELLIDDKFEVPMEKSNDVLHPHEPGSPTKIEVSGDSINLFVEVFGPLDGISDDKLGEDSFKQDSSLKETGFLSAGVTEEGVNGEEERLFEVGDLVWVKTRTQLWWPCMVSDPSTAPHEIAKCEKKGSYLVKLYGSANFIWCGNADLKPFVECFKQMSKQNNSNNFIGSVERAICEIGLRVQSNMTCPCFSKDSQPLYAQRDLGNKSDVVALSQFQPAKFVADIKNLARSIHAPCKVELIVMKNRLSPFYQSIGHLELPQQMLGGNSGDCSNSVEGHDGNFTTKRKYKKSKNSNVREDNITSSDNGSESRERKKSRYLSYPYVDAIKGPEIEDPKQGSCSGMESQKKGTKKALKERHVVKKEDDVNASSVDILAELRSSALDCSYINRSKYSDSLKRFYSSFRVYSFLDADVASKAVEERMKGSKVVKKSKKQKVDPTPANESVGNVDGEKSGVAGDLKSNENAVRKRGRKKKEKVNTATVNESVENVEGDKSWVAEDQKSNENVVRKRRRRKKEKVTNPQDQLVGITVGNVSEHQKSILNFENPRAKENEQSIPLGFGSVQNSPNTGANTIFPKSPWMISFHQACSNLLKTSKTPKKSEGLKPVVSDTKSTPELPDLNGTHPVDHVQVEGLSTNPVEGLVSPIINGVPQSEFTPVSSSKNVPSTFQNTLLSNNGVTAVPYQGLNGGLSLYIQHSLQMGSFLSTGMNEPKKRRRRRKERASEVVSGIPDLNGDATDTSPLGTSTTEGSHVPPEGEIQKKRRNRYESGESGGGNIVLNFAVGTVLSKESLVATFSRFGLLKESELEIPTDDNSSVKIVYERSSDARFAFRSLQKGHAFGESLLSFNLDSCTLETPKIIKKKNNLPLHTFVPVAADSPKYQAKIGEKPDIALIKKNVEMMKSTLEKAGDRLSPETRAKLENEIRAFLDKISSMTASSSS